MGTQLQDLYATVVFFAPRVLGAIATLALFWGAGAMLRRVLLRLARQAGEGRREVVVILARGVYVTLLVVGAVSALGTLGINVAAMVAALGLTGFALGFALKDVLSNMLSGILVLLYQPFRLGDEVQVGGFKGRVLSVDLRYTILETEEGRVLIPNSTLFTQSVLVKETGETA